MKKLIKLLAIVIGAVICITVAGCNGGDDDNNNGNNNNNNGNNNGGDGVLYTVSFETDGGIPETLEDIYVAEGETLGDEIPSVSKTGYDFTGWVSEDGELYMKDTPISKDVTLKPTWKNIGIKLDYIMEDIFGLFAAEKYTAPSGFALQNSTYTYGETKEVTYYSNFTKVNRKCMVITPPNYDKTKKYPVLYLLHGIGGLHNTDWMDCNADRVINNLINAGKAKPMIVVVPNARAMVNDTNTANNSETVAAFHNFIHDLQGSLMPFIKENYSVSDRRDQTAIAGLSMGAMESLHIGCRIPEYFGYVGAFSSAPSMPLSAAQQTIPDEWKKDMFFMLCCGTEDTTALSSHRSYLNNLKNNGVRTASFESPGAHDNNYWRNALYFYARCIFQFPE